MVTMMEECTYVAGHIETEPRQAILERCFCDLVDLVEGVRGVGAAEGYASSLGGEDGVVEVFLGSGEGARDGPRAGDVGDVVAVFLWVFCESVFWNGVFNSWRLTPPASARTRSPSLGFASMRV